MSGGADVETVREALHILYAYTSDAANPPGAGRSQTHADGRAALARLEGRVAEAEKALARVAALEAALVEVGGGWRDAESPPCYCAGDSTTERLARCTRIRELLTPLRAAAVVSTEPPGGLDE